MKRLSIFAIVISVLLVLVGCQQVTEQAVEEAPVPSDPPSTLADEVLPSDIPAEEKEEIISESYFLEAEGIEERGNISKTGAPILQLPSPPTTLNISPSPAYAGQMIIVNVSHPNLNVYRYAYILRGKTFYHLLRLNCPKYFCDPGVVVDGVIPGDKTQSWSADTYTLRIYYRHPTQRRLWYKSERNFYVQGQQITPTSLTIIHEEVSHGDDLNISIIPGSAGVYWYIMFHRDLYGSNDPSMGHEYLCSGGPVCYNPVNILKEIPSDWPEGGYYVQLFDVGTNDYMYGYFNVTTPTVPTTGSIYATSNPVGANLYVDGQSEGTTPNIVHNLSAGSHRVAFSLSGYNGRTEWATVIAGQTTNVSVTLTAIAPPTNQTNQTNPTNST